MAVDKLLKEDGDKILQEDGSFILLGPPDPVDYDGGDSWWAGVNFSYVCVPLTIAALALSVSVATANTFIQNDELPPQTTVPADTAQEPSSGQRLQYTPVFQRWAFTDEFMPSVVDEDPRPLESPRPAGIDSRVWTVEDELSPHLDEDYWWSASSFASPLSPSIQSLPVSDDDFVPPVSTLVEETEWPLVQPRSSAMPVVVWGTDEGFAPVPVVVEEDWLVLPVQARTLSAYAFIADDEIVPQPAAVPAEASGLFRQRAQQATTFWRWATPDDLPQFVAPSPLIDEDYWFTYVPAPVPPRSFAFGEADDFVPFVLDGDASYAIVVIGDDAVRRVFTDEDWVPPAAPQESDWQVWTPPLVAARPLYAPDLDSYITPFQAPIAVEEDWQVWTPPLVVARPIYAPDQDIYTPLASLFEEDWQVWTPPLVLSRPIYAPDFDDVIVPQPPPATIIEEDWQVWTPALVAARPIYAPDLDEVRIPPSVPFEDDVAPLWIFSIRPPVSFYISGHADEPPPIIPIPLDEGYWLCLTQYQPVNAALIAWGDDQAVPLAFTPDENQAWNPPTIASTLAKTIVWVDGDTEFQPVVVEAEWQVWTPPLVPPLPICAPDFGEIIVPFVPTFSIIEVVGSYVTVIEVVGSYSTSIDIVGEKEG